MIEKIRVPGVAPISGLGLLLALLVSGAVRASPLFESESVMEITLAGPIGALLRDARKKTDLPFKLRDVDGQLEVNVRARGHSRLQVCDFPPLRLEFTERPPSHSDFAGQRGIKMVTHCRNSARGEQDLLDEFVAYRLFNAVTELSFRVRLLRVHYVGDDGAWSDGGESYYGFLIEPIDEFAARAGVQPTSRAGFPLNRQDSANAALMYVMQYLLGNTDYMMIRADYDDKCCHNVELFERGSKVISVPYDFDLSGLVNAGYARPDPKLRIRRVTQRLYRGLCTERIYLESAVDTVLKRKEDIMTVIGGVPGMESRNRERAVRYVEKFFVQAQDKQKLLDSFERACLDGY